MRRPCWLIGGLLAACGDPTLYPDFPNGLEEQALLDTGLPDVQLACGRADEGTVAQLTVNNVDVGKSYELYTVDAACTETLVTTLAPATSFTTTVGNHLAWSAYGPRDRRVRSFGLPSGSGVIWSENVP